jgi:ABC-type branched-subunit amino acid transport system substrate-binding protein
MLKRLGFVATAGMLAALAIVAAAIAGPTASSAATVSCRGGVTIGVMAPITGPAASIGADQLHWAQYMAAQWNKKNTLKVHIFQGDTQLDPSKASTVGQQIASNSKILAVVGPAGSQEVLAVTPIFKKAGVAFISGSATLVKLTNGSARGYFYRVVPSDNLQGNGDAAYMLSKLGVKKGDGVMIIDDQEAYSTGLAGIVQSKLSAAGVKVDRESISQTATDFSSLVAKVTSSTKVVFLPFQLASQAQLVAQQLKAQGKSVLVFGTDGTFDSSKFTEGNYVSFFAPDVTAIPADKATVAAYTKQYGKPGPFGAPSGVALQVLATAAQKACAAGKGSTTRAAVRAQIRKVHLKTTILGIPMSFTVNGDIKNPGKYIFKIVNGKYVFQP